MLTGKVSQELWARSTNAGDTALSRPSMVAGLRRASYVALGCTFFVVGILGVLLPGLPATPFFLLASYFLVRSAPTLHERMLRLHIVGGLLRDWEKHRGVRMQVKVTAVIMVLAVMISTVASGRLSPIALAAFLVAATVGLLVVLRLPVVHRNHRPE